MAGGKRSLAGGFHLLSCPASGEAGEGLFAPPSPGQLEKGAAAEKVALDHPCLSVSPLGGDFAGAGRSREEAGWRAGGWAQEQASDTENRAGSSCRYNEVPGS